MVFLQEKSWFSLCGTCKYYLFLHRAWIYLSTHQIATEPLLNAKHLDRCWRKKTKSLSSWSLLSWEGERHK